MRILITGGAGFIGSHLSEYLLEQGHDVICMDNLLTGKLENIAHMISGEGGGDNPKYSFVNYDVTNFIYVNGPLDYVLHFASPASPVDYLKLPIHTLKVGAHGTHNSLGLAMAKGARFLIASTSEVYGDPLIHPQPEHYWGNVNPVGIRGVYDEAKRFAEAMTMALSAVPRDGYPHSADLQHLRGRACARRTGERCPPSSRRPSRVRTSPYSVTAPRRAHSATLRIS